MAKTGIKDRNIKIIKKTLNVVHVAEQAFAIAELEDEEGVSASYSTLLLSMQMIQENLQGLNKKFTMQYKELDQLYTGNGLWFKNDRLFVSHNLDINKLYSSKKDLLEYFRNEYFGILKPMLYNILGSNDAQPSQETNNIVVEQRPVMLQKHESMLGAQKLEDSYLLRPYIINLYACVNFLTLNNHAPATIAIILQTIGNNIRQIRQKCSQQSLDFLNSLEDDDFLWLDVTQIRNNIVHSTDFNFLNNIQEYNEIVCELIPKMKIITNHFFAPIKQEKFEMQHENDFRQVELKHESIVTEVSKVKNKKSNKAQVEEKTTKSLRRKDNEKKYLRNAILFCLAARAGNEDEMRKLIKEGVDINKPLLFTFVTAIPESRFTQLCHYTASDGYESADYTMNFKLDIKPPKTMLIYPLSYIIESLSYEYQEFLKPVLKIMLEENMANFNVENISTAGNREPIVYKFIEVLEFRPVVLEVILDAGLDPSYAYRYGESLIWQSCVCIQPEALTILIKRGADILAPCKNYGYTKSSAKNNTNLARQINILQLMGFWPELDVIRAFFGASLEKRLVGELTKLLIKY